MEVGAYAMLSTLNPVLVRDTVSLALREDIPFEDLTSEACIPGDTRIVTEIRAREKLVVAGAPLLRETFSQVSQTIKVHSFMDESEIANPGTTIYRIEGYAREVLAGERVALNFLQRLCGIATLTRSYVDALAPGSKTRITDTRKTTPGHRAFERYAVRCGGGYNHRNDLSAAILIKDNHIAACGGVREAIERARNYAPQTSTITCEVDTLTELDEALTAGADCVLLDNFNDAQTAEAIALAKGPRARGDVWVESSGGITLERVRSLSALGVDSISVGALTHSSRAVDLGLDVIEQG